MHVLSNDLSTLATISSLILSKLFPDCFFCYNNFNLSQSSSGLVGQNFVEIPKAMIAADFNKFISDLSLSLFGHFCLILEFFSFPNS